MLTNDMPAKELLAAELAMPYVQLRLGRFLRNENIYTVGDLLRFTEAEMLRCPDMGHRTVKVIVAALVRHGLKPGETAGLIDASMAPVMFDY